MFPIKTNHTIIRVTVTTQHSALYKLPRQWLMPEMDYNVGQTVTDISGRVLTCTLVCSVTVVCHNASQPSTHHNLDLSN